MGILAVLLLRIMAVILCTVLGILLLILLVPFRYRAKGFRQPDDFAAEGSASWLFGLIGVRWSIDSSYQMGLEWQLFSHWRFSIKTGKTIAANDHPQKKQEKEKKEAKHPQHPIVLTKSKICLLTHSATTLLKGIMPRRFLIDAHIGFEDPADTGYFCAALATLAPLLQNRKHVNVRIVPVFDEAQWTGIFRIDGRIQIWFIVWVVLKLAISKPFRQDIFGLLKPKAKQRKGGLKHV